MAAHHVDGFRWLLLELDWNGWRRQAARNQSYVRFGVKSLPANQTFSNSVSVCLSDMVRSDLIASQRNAFVNAACNICTDNRNSMHSVRGERDLGAIQAPRDGSCNWIAHQYQHPGVPLPTDVWFISLEQGMGKTLFGELFRDLLGRSDTAAANPAELRGEWSDYRPISRMTSSTPRETRTERWIADMIEAGRWKTDHFVAFNRLFEWYQN